MGGDALAPYNHNHTPHDRVIADYYEKIRSGKQEKPFHEIILQIGNCYDTAADSLDGELARAVLDEYMCAFPQRNPNMRVFSAHLHMDEATPHLHIDFVPFTTGSKRGLDTRVSLKSALAEQGFTGGTRAETEWAQWVTSEKEQLATVMERYGIQWLQKGTHEKHLSVLDFEKKMRIEEVESLEATIDDLVAEVKDTQKSADDVQAKLGDLQERENLIDLRTGKYDTAPEWQLPEPTRLMSATAYKTKIVEPFVRKLKGVIGSIVAQYLELRSTVDGLRSRLSREISSNERLMDKITEERQANTRLSEIAKDYKRVRSVLGDERTESIVAQAKADEQSRKRPIRSRIDERGR
ncbi:MAG: plasmid recombination protein [Gordonibacter sp.]|uniref:plasmid recombination protein n=1 Tax=Gordonibacter sp. TaxID=1968902 RepID=UPI002FC5B7EC